MTVVPGLGGQKLLEFVLPKIRRLSELRMKRGCSYELEVDGGVRADNAHILREAGVSVMVAGSAYFGAEDKKKLLGILRGEEA